MSIKDDPWLPLLPDFHLLGSGKQCSVRWVAELTDESTGQWHLPLLHSFHSRDCGPYFSSSLSISRVSRYSSLDIWSWALFSVKDAVLKMQEARRSPRLLLSEHDSSKLWKLKLQERLKLILWKVAGEAIPIRALPFCLNNSELYSNMCCIGCTDQAKTILLVFRDCSIAHTLWMLSAWPLDISRVCRESLQHGSSRCLMLRLHFASVLAPSLLSYSMLPWLWMSYGKIVTKPYMRVGLPTSLFFRLLFYAGIMNTSHHGSLFVRNLLLLGFLRI